MIKFLKKYENKSFEDLVNGIIWQDLPFRLKAIFSKLRDLVSANEPSYKVYTALLTQSGTDAPVATVLENTLGVDINWIRDDIGYYIGTPTEENSIPSNSYMSVNNGSTSSFMQSPVLILSSLSDDNIEIGSAIINLELSSFDAKDGELNGVSIEIRVYN